MKPKIIAQGAEATILRDKNRIIKKRLVKGYRHHKLDEKIRKSRTKREAKLLEKAGKIILIPNVLNQETFEIDIEYIEGDKLSETLNDYNQKKQLSTINQLGEQVAKLHKNNIIHGDLTTSNTILKQNKLYIIDFGLGFISSRIEDKAVDIHLIKQALEAKHFQNHKELFKAFLEGYITEKTQSVAVLEQLKKVEARGRYKH